jgi:NADPH:quinone reductase-like Zn-dependent oxidoreductase
VKAIRFHEYGDPGVLRYEDADRPEPAEGEVLVADGAAAEFVTVPAQNLALAPTTIPLAHAAALPSAAQTAWQALFEHAALDRGQRVLINGAGGGVGGYAVRLAKQAGAFVIATASARSAEAVHAQGGDQIIDYTATTPAEALTEPVDAVLNLVAAAGSGMVALTGLIRDGGVIVTTATPAAGDPGREVRAVGMQLRTDVGRLAALAKRVDAGELSVEVSAVYPLSQAATVHELAAAGRNRGKVLLIPAP